MRIVRGSWNLKGRTGNFIGPRRFIGKPRFFRTDGTRPQTEGMMSFLARTSHQPFEDSSFPSFEGFEPGACPGFQG